MIYKICEKKYLQKNMKSIFSKFIICEIVFVFFVLIIYNFCKLEKLKFEKLEELENNFQNYSINFPYIEENEFTRPMEKFDKTYLYTMDTAPKVELFSEYQILFDLVVKKVSRKKKLDLSTFINGNYRLLKNGLEYNLFFSGNKRISVFQPFSDSLFVKDIEFVSSQKVNIVMPLKGKLSSLDIFLDNLLKKILPVDQNLSLTIVYFNDGSAASAKALIKKKLSDFPFFEYNFVPVNDKSFSRGKGINIGIEVAAKKPSDLIFVCDVDILIIPDFLGRCRANAVYGHQVYFPVVFSLYNPKVVYSMYEKPVPDILNQLEVGSDNGFWRYFGFGMFCMYKKEYNINGGIPELSSWGSEDPLFYNRFAKFHNIKVIRSLDASIFHIFHHKNCNNVTSKLYISCMKSKASNEGTNVQLALLHYNSHEGINVEGILNKRFYYFYWIPVLAIILCASILGMVYQQRIIYKMKKELESM